MNVRSIALAAIITGVSGCNCGSGNQQMTGGGSSGATGGGVVAGGSAAGGRAGGTSGSAGGTAGGASTAGGVSAGGSAGGVVTAGGASGGVVSAGGAATAGGTSGGSTAGGSVAGGSAGGQVVASDGGVDIGCAVVRPIRHDAGPADGLCATPLPVGAPPALVYGDTRTGLDTQSTCGFSMGAGERNYLVTLPTGGELTIDLMNLSFDAGFKPLVGVYLDCTGQQVTSACRASHPTQALTHVVLPSIDAGPYIVVVDGLDGTEGDFSLSMCLRPTPQSAAGDTCASPVPLTFTNQQVRVVSNTLGMADDVTFVEDDGVPCFGEIDRVYAMDLPDAGPGGTWDVVARVIQQTDESFAPGVVFIDACPIGVSFIDAGVIACGQGRGSNTGHPTGATLNHHLSSGRHYLWVQGTPYNPVRGHKGYELDVQFAKVGSLANDACSSTSPQLQPNTSYAGSLIGATNDLDGIVCLDASGQLHSAGAEVFYRYVAPSTGMATFEVQGVVGTDFYLGVFTACSATSCLGMANPNGTQGQTTVSFPVTQGTTYWVMVEEYDLTNTPPPTIARGNRGAYGIRVSQ